MDETIGCLGSPRGRGMCLLRCKVLKHCLVSLFCKSDEDTNLSSLMKIAIEDLDELPPSGLELQSKQELYTF